MAKIPLRLLVCTLFACGPASATPPAKPATVDLSAGGKLTVVPFDNGLSYVIDPNAQACFLFLPNATPAGAVSCHKLKERVPAAAPHVSWEDDESLRGILRRVENMPRLIPVDPPGDPLAAPPADEGEGEVAEKLRKGIKTLGRNKYRITKGLRDEFLERPHLLAKGSRIVPEIKDGKPAGFKLFAIRPDSLYAFVGIRNGDIVKAINGNELTTADRALEVYTKVREQDKLRLDIRRGDEDVVIHLSFE